MSRDLNNRIALSEVSKVICSNLGTPAIENAGFIKQENEFCYFEAPLSWKQFSFRNDPLRLNFLTPNIKKFKARYVAKSNENIEVYFFIEEKNTPTTLLNQIETFNNNLHFEGYKVVTEENIGFNNKKNIAYKCNFETAKDKCIQIISVIGNIVYSITYKANPESYIDYLEDFNCFLDSFQDKNIASSTSQKA